MVGRIRLDLLLRTWGRKNGRTERVVRDPPLLLTRPPKPRTSSRLCRPDGAAAPAGAGDSGDEVAGDAETRSQRTFLAVAVISP